LATAPVPVLPPPPARLSTSTCWPSLGPIFSATMRMKTSGDEPAA
jgi:hypothetical protein